VPIEHPDAAALAVACRLLSQQQLHRRIREQGGAYGSNATFSPGSGTIALSSYRDPRFGGTFSDFDESIAWLLEAPEDERLLKEAILAIIAGIDNPGSPAGEANRRFQADNIGHGPAVVDRYRSQVIGTSIGDVRRVAQTWLQGVPCTEASITDKDRLANERPDWEALAL
jgi:Zn-dependent M16 (insulinase) family peptidase